jgi:hypothetical protein
VHAPVDTAPKLVDDPELEAKIADELLATKVLEITAAELAITDKELEGIAEEELLVANDELEDTSGELAAAGDELVGAAEEELLRTIDEPESAAEDELGTAVELLTMAKLELLGARELELELELGTNNELLGATDELGAIELELEIVKLETTGGAATLFAAKLVFGALVSAVGFADDLK